MGQRRWVTSTAHRAPRQTGCLSTWEGERKCMGPAAACRPSLLPPAHCLDVSGRSVFRAASHTHPCLQTQGSEVAPCPHTRGRCFVLFFSVYFPSLYTCSVPERLAVCRLSAGPSVSVRLRPDPSLLHTFGGCGATRASVSPLPQVAAHGCPSRHHPGDITQGTGLSHPSVTSQRGKNSAKP